MPASCHQPADRPGAYLLVLRLGKSLRPASGGRTCGVAGGWYVLVGSAMNGLVRRLNRQLRPSTTRNGMADQLLAAGRVADIQIRRAVGGTRGDCALAAAVSTWPGARPVSGFGGSSGDGGTHLFAFAERPPCSLHAANLLGELENIYGALRQLYDNHALAVRDPFQTLIKCILSLRTQDPVTDAAAERLFAELRTPQQFAVADAKRIAALIFPVGMYRRKADTLIVIAQQLLARFAGETPAAIEKLVTLPGVGRKTANLVRSFAFHLPAICVDTHVHRITNRWGLVRTVTPEATETELRRLLPAAYWIETNALLIQHGQQVCRPLGPKCDRCTLAPWCRFPLLKAEQELLASVAGAPGHPSLFRTIRNAQH